MAEALTKAVHVRSAITDWLLSARLPNWDLGLVVISEYHSVIEAMWHGFDEEHPLHGEASACAASHGIERVYEAGDQMLGTLMKRFDHCRMVVFSMHGMGPNNADVPSTLLLPELLYRDHFREPFFQSPQWGATASRVATMDADSAWERAIWNGFPRQNRFREKVRGGVAKVVRRVAERIRPEPSLDWMPATKYMQFWRQMPAFALPAYYDGRIRLNLIGRESNGVVPPEAYEPTCDKLERLLNECTDTISGSPVVAKFTRPSKNGLEVASSDADVLVDWHGAPLGLDHPRLGRIGPVPYRRPGGHTGATGVAFFSDPVAAEQSASSFDIVPTVIRMLGLDPSRRLSGRSLV